MRKGDPRTDYCLGGAWSSRLGKRGGALRPPDARGDRSVVVLRLECLWGPGMGVPGPWGPLPPREGPGRLQWQNAPDFSASRPP